MGHCTGDAEWPQKSRYPCSDPGRTRDYTRSSPSYTVGNAVSAAVLPFLFAFSQLDFDFIITSATRFGYTS